MLPRPAPAKTEEPRWNLVRGTSPSGTRSFGVLKPPDSGQIEYSDTLTPGLRVRVEKRSKTFVLLHSVDG
jgi:hypothetical protein